MIAPIPPRRIIVAGATGTIGRAVVGELVSRGRDVTALVRRPPDENFPAETSVCAVDLCDTDTVRRQVFGIGGADAIVSCLASRSGTPADSWAVDHDANRTLLEAAQAAGVPFFLMLSAICVQKPRLAFQHAKLAFEDRLTASGIGWCIVRPTAYFKSLSGQVARVQAGKPFLIFGDGTLTACKPISDGDLARYIADCLDDPSRHGRILPIGGPGPALTPLDQAAMLSGLLGRDVPVKKVPPGLLRAIAGGMGALGKAIPTLRDKAALARIGHYYATESMLVWNEGQGRYDAAATPETGSDTLQEHYARLLSGEAQAGLGAHAVFTP